MRISAVVLFIIVQAGAGCSDSANSPTDVGQLPDTGSSREATVPAPDGPQADQPKIDASRDLGKADLTGADLPKPDLQKPDLSKPDLSRPEMSKLDLPGADLPKPDLGTPDLPLPDLAQPDMPKPDVSAPSCTDGLQNGKETDVDCGGPDCIKCTNSLTCLVDSDCASAFCGPAGKCMTPTCFDNVRDGLESDVDCGGTCAKKCDVGQNCKACSDCAQSYCVLGQCALPISCDALRSTCPALPSGRYTLHPVGSSATNGFDAYCAMTSSGGWTLIMRAIGYNFGYDDTVWTTTTLVNMTEFEFTSSPRRAKYRAFNEVPFTQIRTTDVSDFNQGYTYTVSAQQASALALFSGPGIQISTSLNSHFDSRSHVQNQQWGCTNYINVGINQRDYLGTAPIGGGSYCDWNGGARFGQRVNANQQNTGNHSGQGWGAYSTLTTAMSGFPVEWWYISQALWVR